MNAFSINPDSISYFETGRGVAYSGDLVYKGETIGKVCNEGNGGDTHLVGRCDFHEELEAAATTTCPDSYEPESSYFNHLFDVAEAV